MSRLDSTSDRCARLHSGKQCDRQKGKMTSRFCTQCGTEIAEGKKFCRGCGKPISPPNAKADESIRGAEADPRTMAPQPASDLGPEANATFVMPEQVPVQTLAVPLAATPVQPPVEASPGPQTCTACGQALPAGKRFCGKCGQPATGAQIETKASPDDSPSHFETVATAAPAAAPEPIALPAAAPPASKAPELNLSPPLTFDPPSARPIASEPEAAIHAGFTPISDFGQTGTSPITGLRSVSRQKVAMLAAAAVLVIAAVSIGGWLHHRQVIAGRAAVGATRTVVPNSAASAATAPAANDSPTETASIASGPVRQKPSAGRTLDASLSGSPAPTAIAARSVPPSAPPPAITEAHLQVPRNASSLSEGYARPGPTSAPVQTRLRSGVLHYEGPPVSYGGTVVFRSLSGERMRFVFDRSSWQALISREPDGTQTLTLRSIRHVDQSQCDVQWEMAQ